ncbi:MAG: hypothetical protein IPJ88_02650 [Myxococcales bacterium]|nr:MAG: hypothetical protein IPJ88_02650 [Myxococcales bacterium]
MLVTYEDWVVGVAKDFLDADLAVIGEASIDSNTVVYNLIQSDGNTLRTSGAASTEASEKPPEIGKSLPEVYKVSP